ncbi:universal stress protein [Dictyobacter aurantiacus]|uniref:Universal stress protein UspA n=1 Tax=Dictyobacter aurantiacus TaxID=1936993 RepID=A0A401ZI49_9CHLR|nr:universal stress protein [Dictyobacter aurantiacus]GCE06521.1 universal stress protein UspA [Dictyobacter aurantiacus]
MFKHILVPLDGSVRAEQAIPVAARIARLHHSALVLLESINPMDEMGLATLPREHLLIDMENLYLQNIARSPEVAGLEIITLARIGLPAEQILLAARAYAIDLVVMCSHGRTGLKRWTMGSIAQKITRTSPAPVLVLQEDDPLQQQLRAPHPSTVRIMVALDGSELAETAIAPAAELSMALSAPATGALQLTCVIHLPSSFEYGQEDSVSRALKQETPRALAYLQSIEQQIRNGRFGPLPIELSTALCHNLDVATQMINTAERGAAATDHHSCQLIALTTHGHSGLQRWLTGSVTERILSRARISLLVVRPQQQSRRSEQLSEQGKRVP